MVGVLLTLIADGSRIVTNSIAIKGCHYFDHGLLPLYSPWSMQDERTKIVAFPVTLISGCTGIVTNKIAIEEGQYLDYGFSRGTALGLCPMEEQKLLTLH
jgi:hypothetical protein